MVQCETETRRSSEASVSPLLRPAACLPLSGGPIDSPTDTARREGLLPRLGYRCNCSYRIRAVLAQAKAMANCEQGEQADGEGKAPWQQMPPGATLSRRGRRFGCPQLTCVSTAFSLSLWSLLFLGFYLHANDRLTSIACTPFGLHHPRARERETKSP